MASDMEVSVTLKLLADQFTAAIEGIKGSLGGMSASFNQAGAEMRTAIDPDAIKAAFAALDIKPAADLRAEIERLKGAYDTLRDSGASLEDLARAELALENRTADLNRQLSGSTSLFSTLSAGAQALGISLGALGAAAIGAAFLSANREAERFRLSMTQLTGSSQAAGAAWQDLSSLANRLGLDIMATAKSYVQLQAAAKGSAMEGAQTRQIFEAVAGAMAKLGKSGEETERALNGVGQMMSKGTVAAEELKGQLGDALPGALQAAARATGLTVSELMKLMETGQLLADDFLPLLAAELKKTFSTDQEVQSFDASLNRLKNSFSETLVLIGDSGAFKALSIALLGVNLAVTEVITSFEVVGQELGILAAAVATWDFSRVGEEFTRIEEAASDKIGKATARLLEFSGAAGTAGAAVQKAGEAAGASGSLWIRLSNDYGLVTAEVAKYVELAKKHVETVEAQGKAMQASAALSGDETRQLQAKQGALEASLVARKALLEAEQTELGVLRSKLLAFEAEAAASQAAGVVIGGVKAKQLADLRDEITAKAELVKQGVAVVDALSAESKAAQLAAQTHGDQSAKVNELRAAYLDAKSALEQMTAAQAAGSATAAQVAAARDAEAIALAKYRDALKDAIDLDEKKIQQSQRQTALAQQSAEVSIAQAQAEKALALAKGDTAAASAASLEIAELELAKSRDLVRGKQNELAAMEAGIAKKIEDVKQSTLSAAQKQLEIAAINDGIAAKQNEVALAKAAASSKVAALEQETEAAKKAAAANEQLAQSARDSAGFADALASIINGAAAALNSLSPATAELFFARMGGSAEAAGSQVDALTAQIREAKAAVDASSNFVAFGEWDQYFKNIAGAFNTSKLAFLEQKKMALDATESISRTVKDANASLSDLTAATQYSAEGFGLLGQEQLGPLQSAIDSAKAKLQSLEDAARSAKNALAGMADNLEQEVARARGQLDVVAKLQYEAQKKQLDDQLAASKGTGSAEYSRALAALDAKYQFDAAAAQKQMAQTQAQTRAQAPSSSSGASSTANQIANTAINNARSSSASSAASSSAASGSKNIRIDIRTPEGGQTEVYAPDAKNAQGLIDALSISGSVSGG